MAEPRVILDDATVGRERLSRFSGLRDVISATCTEEVAEALAAIEHARNCGRVVAGYFSYELGYLLEARLQGLLPSQRLVPLLWFGVFDRAEACDARALESAGRAYAGPLQHEWDAEAYGERFRRGRGGGAAGGGGRAGRGGRARGAGAG